MRPYEILTEKGLVTAHRLLIQSLGSHFYCYSIFKFLLREKKKHTHCISLKGLEQNFRWSDILQTACVSHSAKGYCRKKMDTCNNFLQKSPFSKELLCLNSLKGLLHNEGKKETQRKRSELYQSWRGLRHCKKKRKE